MKLMSLVAAMLLSFAANAATFLAVPEKGVEIFVDNKMSCSKESAAKVAALKPPEELKWMAALINIHGEKLVACATEFDGKILLVYEDGDVGVIPVSMFHQVKEA